MNERIRELAEKADGVFIHKLMTGAKQYTFLEKDLEKFAELIVRECVDLLETNSNNQYTIRTVEPESHDKTTDWMAGYEEAVKHYGSFLLKKNAKLIEKHFGIE